MKIILKALQPINKTDSVCHLGTMAAKIDEGAITQSFTCDTCGRSFKSRQGLIKHNIDKHSNRNGMNNSELYIKKKRIGSICAPRHASRRSLLSMILITALMAALATIGTFLLDTLWVLK